MRSEKCKKKDFFNRKNGGANCLYICKAKTSAYAAVKQN